MIANYLISKQIKLIKKKLNLKFDNRVELIDRYRIKQIKLK